ncbi:hypothetical protein [Streptomyces sp. 11x1]|uniref:hypothetical protein n=1 Tax=Streptomyces sp. 11x1 TaxID=3038642 RepID=UPI0029308A6D|nr:hypothetical protein [Streptomyces sp. 11x1]WNZ09916.1 hypothetical protein P8T65_21490 [Streptomyces sp. 11x1]
MPPSLDDSGQFPSPTDSARTRDRGLRRSRRITRWIVAAAVTGAAALGSLYTHLLPGSSASPVPSSPSPHNPAVSSPGSTKTGPEDRGDSARDDADDEHEGEHEDEDEGEDEGEDDAGTAPASRPAPQPPAQPPAPTRQQPHTTTGAS